VTEAERVEIAALVLLAPVFLFPPIGSIWATLVLIVPCVWLLKLALGIQPIPSTPLNGSLFLLTLAILASLMATLDVLFAAPKVLGVVFGIAALFAIVRLIRERGWTMQAIELFSVAGAALAVIGILGTNWMDKMPMLRAITARLPAVIRGVPGQTEGFQPNAIAGALVMFIPVQIVLCFVTAGHRRVLHAAALFVTFFTVVITQSRGGYLGLLAAGVLWLLWSGRRPRRWTIGVLVIAAIIAIPFRQTFERVVLHQVGSGVATDVPERFELWSRAIDIVSDFPLTGVGMNGTRRVMPVMYPLYLTPPDMEVPHAHDQLLQVSADIGLPGLIAYLALWFGAAAMLVRVTRVAQNVASRRLASGFGAGLIAYFVFGIADAIALGAKVGIFFWIAMALIVSLHESVHEGPREGIEQTA
jgi:putative inorganic carbon (HCO3(-)) transporter